MRRALKALLVVLLVVPCVTAVPGRAVAAEESQPALIAKRLPGADKISVDGRLDEDAWLTAPALHRFFQIDPVPRDTPPVRTEVRFVYDSTHLYVGVWAHDPDLSALHAPMARRDGIEADHDHVTVYLDTMGERRFAQFFDVNPIGVVADGLFNEQTGLDDPAPNYRFQVRTGRFDGGWTIELAIPFSSLLYPRGEKGTARQPWSVLVTRNYPREQAYYMASAPLPQNGNCMLCFASNLTQLSGLPDTLSVEGSMTLSAQRRTEHNGDEPRIERSTASAGADLKLRPRPDTVVNMTLRPDFSQVEIDAPQLSSNTRYAIYFSEKRQFFLETADILASPLPVLRTRSISAPSWGLRATQRNDRIDATVIVAGDRAGGGLLLPSQESTGSLERNDPSKVLMARGRMHLEQATLGVLYSERRNGVQLGDNRVAGVDLSWNPAVADRVDLQWLHSASTALQRERGLPDAGSAGLARWSHKSDAMDVDAAYRHYGRGFRADNGFIEVTGVREVEAKLTGKHPRDGSVREVGLYVGHEGRQSLDGPLLQARRQLGAYAILPLSTTLWAAPWSSVDKRAAVATSLRRLNQYQFGLKSVPALPWLAEITFEATGGDGLDVLRDRVGTGREAHLMLRMQPMDRLYLQVLVDQLAIDGAGGASNPGRWLSERASQWLAIFFIAPDHHLRLIRQSWRVQRDAPVGDVPAQGRDRSLTLSYQVRLGVDMLLDAGVSSGRTRNTDPDWHSGQREVFVKWTWDFK